MLRAVRPVSHYCDPAEGAFHIFKKDAATSVTGLCTTLESGNNKKFYY